LFFFDVVSNRVLAAAVLYCVRVVRGYRCAFDSVRDRFFVLKSKFFV